MAIKISANKINLFNDYPVTLNYLHTHTMAYPRAVPTPICIRNLVKNTQKKSQSVCQNLAL